MSVPVLYIAFDGILRCFQHKASNNYTPLSAQHVQRIPHNLAQTRSVGPSPKYVFFYSCVFFTKFLDIETSVTNMSNDYQNGGSRTSRNDEGSRPAHLEPLTVCFFSLNFFFQPY